MVDPGDAPAFDQNLVRKALGEVAKPADDGRTRPLTLPGTLATANELKTILAALRHRPAKADFATALAAIVSACIAIYKALGSKLPDGGWHIGIVDVAFIVLSAVAFAVAIIRYINARSSKDPLTDEAIRMVVEYMKSEGQITEEQASKELAQIDKPTPMVVQYVLLAGIVGIAVWRGPGTAAVIVAFIFFGNLIDVMRKRAATAQPVGKLNMPGTLRAKAAELVAKADLLEADSKRAPVVVTEARPAPLATEEAAIDPSLPAPGSRVVHAKFGEGEVRSVVQGSEPALLVSFPAHGEKKIIARFLTPK